MADPATEITRLKAAIADMLKKVPPSVCRGGLSYTNSYREAVKSAQKVLSNSRGTLGKAQAAYASLNSFWSAA